ncbi:MAG: hypothetical protein ABI782_10570 [Anaerolineaceae bacterium]
MSTASTTSGATAEFFRKLILAFGALIVVATATELTLERHWGTTVRLIPWFALVLVGFALLLVAIRPGPSALRVAQVLAVAVIAASAIGVWKHIEANYDAGPLDFRYSASWGTMSETTRWWKAATKSVGPSPILAPGVLAQASLCVLAATFRHPARRARNP